MKLYLLSISDASFIPENYCIARFPARYERSKRFRREEDRLRCIGAGALISGILHADESDIVTGDQGKLYLKNDSRYFNISHSGNYTIMAAGSEEMGADIELIKEPPEAVAGKVFTAEERSWMCEDAEKFFILWTLKESVLKALGFGLTLDPASFSVMNAVEGGSIEAEGRTLFCSYTVFDGHAVSVCSFNPVDGIELNRVSINDIIQV